MSWIYYQYLGLTDPNTKSEKLKTTSFWRVKRGAEVEVRNIWFRQCFGNSDLERLCFAAHIPPTMSVISHVLSITAPLSYTFTANRPPVLITKKKKRKKKTRHQQWRNEQTPRVTLPTLGWKSANERMIAYLATQSFAQFRFPCLHSPVSEIQAVIVLSTYSLTCAASSELTLHCPFSDLCYSAVKKPPGALDIIEHNWPNAI